MGGVALGCHPERYWLVKRFRVWRDCLVDSWTKLNVVDTRINATSSDANLNFERGDLGTRARRREIERMFSPFGAILRDPYFLMFSRVLIGSANPLRALVNRGKVTASFGEVPGWFMQVDNRTQKSDLGQSLRPIESSVHDPGAVDGFWDQGDQLSA